jgi:hypothetical protein
MTKKALKDGIIPLSGLVFPKKDRSMTGSNPLLHFHKKSERNALQI